ncbi:GNAT family N-acetyltransferase [Candidatus Cyanaurora vandensis]|uniref:GNAT family N-acetyltransferase n=1 Tax=Candidatus Cyanaurora vandensis TaxID=2714958 RepID=UPI00257D4E41|nr:GNAT family N-acetyltransferase [Candidatus Cyanaurora vandensis]
MGAGLRLNWTWGLDSGGIALTIRTAVFVIEQQVPPELELDAQDTQAWHLVAHLGQEPVGTLRVFRDEQGQWTIGRMAVQAGLRGRGYGRQLMIAALDYARELNASTVTLHAQVQAIPFYEKLGFHAHGEVFLDADIPHRHMTTTLGP